MDLDSLTAAVELHRPRLLDMYGRPTTELAEAKWIRCEECQMSVPVNGCRTWKTANRD